MEKHQTRIFKQATKVIRTPGKLHYHCIVAGLSMRLKFGELKELGKRVKTYFISQKLGSY